jgi:hypothetical protein
MNLNQLTVAKWGSRAYLVGVGLALGYGLTQGDPLAAWDNTALFVALNPVFVGFSIGLNGIGKCMTAQAANAANTTVDNNQVDLDDDNSDFLDDQPVDLDTESSDDGTSYAFYDTYGTF